MKLISWNVNGLRACLGKGFLGSMQALDPDVICLQETKMQPGQAEVDLPGYTQFWNSAENKGYSGTALFTRVPPLAVTYGIGSAQHDSEGRAITAEFADFYLVTCYTPNAQRELTRLPFRMVWEDELRVYLKGLEAKKPVVLCGDLNVAHAEIDLKNAKSNRGNAGFTDEEREKMTQLLASGFLDTFRYFYPDKTGAYSWWSYMYHARENNAGWRIDYFLASQALQGQLKDSLIHPDIQGSDHCPVELDLF
ncbi:MAG: exodeoxyribonuclease III [Pseudoflavonifractor sp.]